MKTVCTQILSLKKLAFLLTLSIAFFGTACNKDTDATPNEEAITAEESIALVEAALVEGAEGLTHEVEDAVEVAELVLAKTLTNTYCGLGKDSTLVRSFDRPRLSGSYSTSWNWLLNCDEQEIPVNLNFSRKATGSYESLRLSSDDKAESDWVLDDLVFGTEYVLNGTYQRVGTQASKVRQQNTFTSTVEFTVTDLSVGKVKRRINSGSAALLVVGQGSNGESFSFSGTVDFLGDGAATVTINGEVYEIDLR
ncbi:MAG: hypothetical protein KTR30_26375 [Saprospiraceae bacterium]|nr:hypothetical protein [Saprospiraceae bacterium]